MFISGFRMLHSSSLVTREVINQYSLLYTIKGSDPSILPYMLCAHLDVVPVVEEEWDVPTFNASKIDGFIYSRGTIDDKGALLVCILLNVHV